MKRLVHVRPDGGVDIEVPDERFIAKAGGEDAAIALLLKHHEDQGRPAPHVCEETDLPSGREFREAWVVAGKKKRAAVKVDMPRAREVWRDKIREVRAPLLADLDVDYQRADELGDARAKATVAQQKQALRDATGDPAIEAAKTPEVLKTIWPQLLAELSSR